jgi:ADP-ribose pyrophosphatase YjhB (NUDIX family)
VLHDGKLLAMRRQKIDHEYFTLVGGGVEAGEELEAALRRELREETSLAVGTVRLVFIEDGAERFGTQYIFLCEYLGGDPVLAVDSEEAAASAAGQNIYQPLWLPLEDLPRVRFRSTAVREALLTGLQGGWPPAPVELAYTGDDVGK